MMIIALVLLPWRAYSQQTTQPALFSQPEIEQLVAPIALYPDALLAQVLMASTYPLEIVSASRWVKANPNLKDKALEDALQQQSWDASVKSLTTVPQVLEMLNEKLDMTQKLGDAFLAQQKDVLNAVQRLRAKAQEKGNLHSSKEQVINSTQEEGAPIITIEPADPQVIYVPTYDPSVVYGSWPYPSYPPYDYYPPNYVAGTALLSFGASLAVGNAIWGNCNWHNGNVNVDVNRYNSFNRTNINNPNWQHNVEHRKGVQYRDKATQQKYGKVQTANIDSREAFRGRAEQGQNDLARGGLNTERNTAARRPNQNVKNRSEMPNRSSQQHNRASQYNRPSSGQGGARRSETFQGINHGAQTRNYSNRGASSRGAAVNRGSRGGGGVQHRGGGGGGGGGRRR